MKTILLLAFIMSLGTGTFPQSHKKIKVYLLGTFHFADTDTSIFDIKHPSRQRELQEVCTKIGAIQPAKIFIERMPDFEYETRMDSLYQAYKKGDTLRRRNEIWQIAFRVASRLNHHSVYQCDHPGQYGSYYQLVENYARTNGQMAILSYQAKGTTRPLSHSINRDSLYTKNSLLSIFRFINSKEYQHTSHASYITVFPQTGNVNVFRYDSNYLLGAELTADWYRRNIKIYSKMINQLDYEEKAIFLLIGNDHIPIIRHLFESNPWFEVIDTEKWLGSNKRKQ